jgi:hypothetical protein
VNFAKNDRTISLSLIWSEKTAGIIVSDFQWHQIGNILLAMFTFSYIASLVLFLILRPRDLLEWVTTLKTAGVAAVGLNGLAIIYLGVGTNQPFRVIVFFFATIFCWMFTGLAWRERLRRRRMQDNPTMTYEQSK